MCLLVPLADCSAGLVRRPVAAEAFIRPQDFEAQYVRRRRPVRLWGEVEGCGARECWGVEELRRRGGGRTVPVEVRDFIKHLLSV